MISKFIENKRVILSLVFFTIILVIIFTMFNRCSRKVFKVDETETKRIEEPQKKLSLYTTNNFWDIISDLAKKEREWSEIPLSKNFLDKYNNKDGIFYEYDGYAKIHSKPHLDMTKEEVSIKDNKFDVDYDLCWYLNPEVDMGIENYYRLIQIKVTYFINDKGEIDDLIKGEPKIKYDDGFLVKDYDKFITEENAFLILYDILFYDHNSMYYVHMDDRPPIEKLPVTKKLLDKVVRDKTRRNRPYFNNFFEDLQFQIGGVRKKINQTKKQSFDNRCCYAFCELYNDDVDLSMVLSGDDEVSIPEKIYLYKLTFKIDDNDLLDDFELEYLGEYSAEEINKTYNSIFDD